MSATKTKTPKSLQAFEFWDTDFSHYDNSPDDPEWRGHCWFCDHDQPKFYVNQESTLYSCKHCGESGNLTTYLNAIYQYYLQDTTTDDYKHLASQRLGIPWQSFRDAGFACYSRTLDGEAGDWIIPLHSPRGNVVNLRYCYSPATTGSESFEIHNTPGLGLGLFNVHSTHGSHPVFIVEGEWDCLALQHLLNKSKRRGSVVSVPGAQIFKNEWVQFFHGRTTTIAFDNDNPGYTGSHAVAEKLRGHTQSTSIITWPTNLPEGFDVRDYIVARTVEPTRVNYKATFDDFVGMAVDVNDANIVHDDDFLPNPVTRNAFTEIVTDFRDVYHLSAEAEDALAIMCAVTLSTQIPGDPIWMFVVAPPGTGKTLFLRAFEKSPAVIYRSSLTPKSLISGFRTEDGTDPSLIPQLTGKTLVLKDYTEITAMNAQEQEEIYGILRGAYDGRCDKTFGHGEHREYIDCYFGMLAGVTDVIHGNQRAALGERFLKFQMIDNTGHDYDADEHIHAALASMSTQTQNDEFIRNAVASFTDQDLDVTKLPKVPAKYLTRIVALSQLIAYLRAQVPRVGNDIAYQAAPEVGTRLAKQLLKLAQCLSVVWGTKGKIDERCYNLIQRVALDTARSWKLTIFLYILSNYLNAKKMTTRSQIIQHTGLPEVSARRMIEDLTMLRVIEHSRQRKQTRGNPAFQYKPTSKMLDYWKTAKYQFPASNTSND